MDIASEIDAGLRDMTTGASAAGGILLIWKGKEIPAAMGTIKRNHEHVEGGEWPIYSAQAIVRRSDLDGDMPQNGDLIEIKGFVPFPAQSGRRVNKTLRVGQVSQMPGWPSVSVEIVNAPVPQR